MGLEKQHTAAELSGICKKIAVELEGYPMESHQVVVSMLAQLFQHRAMSEKNRLEQEQIDRQRAQDQRNQEQHELMQKHQQMLEQHQGATEVKSNGKAVVGVTQ